MNCISWAQAIQSSGTSSILLKGILRKQFECKRGFAKGIQFHHVLLYLFVSDLLRSSVNQMVLQGSVYLPIITNDEDFPIIQYPDDTLLILRADKEQFMALKEIFFVNGSKHKL
jgi:hypothetical protein